MKVYLKLLITEGDVGFHSCKAGPVWLKSESVSLRSESGLVVKFLLVNIFPRENSSTSTSTINLGPFFYFVPLEKVNLTAKQDRLIKLERSHLGVDDGKEEGALKADRPLKAEDCL